MGTRLGGRVAGKDSRHAAKGPHGGMDAAGVPRAGADGRSGCGRQPPEAGLAVLHALTPAGVIALVREGGVEARAAVDDIVLAAAEGVNRVVARAGEDPVVA